MKKGYETNKGEESLNKIKKLKISIKIYKIILLKHLHICLKNEPNTFAKDVIAL